MLVARVAVLVGIRRRVVRLGLRLLQPAGEVNRRLVVHDVVRKGDASLTNFLEQKGRADLAKGGGEEVRKAVDRAQRVLEERQLLVVDRVDLVEDEHVCRLHLLNQQLHDARGGCGLLWPCAHPLVLHVVSSLLISQVLALRDALGRRVQLVKRRCVDDCHHVLKLDHPHERPAGGLGLLEHGAEQLGLRDAGCLEYDMVIPIAAHE